MLGWSGMIEWGSVGGEVGDELMNYDGYCYELC